MTVANDASVQVDGYKFKHYSTGKLGWAGSPDRGSPVFSYHRGWRRVRVAGFVGERQPYPRWGNKWQCFGYGTMEEILYNQTPRLF